MNDNPYRIFIKQGAEETPLENAWANETSSTPNTPSWPWWAYGGLGFGSNPLNNREEMGVTPYTPSHSVEQTDKIMAFSPGASREEIVGILDEKLSQLRVYVVESDISEAQNRVRSMVELASF